MRFHLKADYTIQKILNNNFVLVTQKKKEKILFSKGLGFGKHLGDILSSDTKIDKIFYLEDKINRHNFKELVTTVDNELIVLCEEITFKKLKHYIKENSK